MIFLDRTKKVDFNYRFLDKGLRKRIKKKLCLYPSRNFKCPKHYFCIDGEDKGTKHRIEYLNQIINEDYRGILKEDETS